MTIAKQCGWRLYAEDYMGERCYRGYNYRRTWHPEFHGYVFQLDTRVFGWEEPVVTEREAHAYIDGFIKGISNEQT